MLFEVVSKPFDIRYVQIIQINNLEPIRNLKVFSWSYQLEMHAFYVIEL